MSDDILTFYHAAPSRSSVVHWMLEEVGQPFQIKPIDLAKGEQKAPDYLALNPMGKVPALAHRGVVITEVAAVCCYLADAFPAAALAPAIGDPDRGTYLRWLFFSPGTLEPAIMDRLLQRPPGPAQALGYGDLDITLRVVAAAVAEGPYLLGQRFTAADVVIGSCLRWGLMFGGLEPSPEIAAYVERLAARPALQRAQARDEVLAAARGG